MRHRTEIDGLRAIAVLPVILFHAGFSLFSGGFVGVDIFFVISGFLITSVMLEEIQAGTFSLRWFYLRRARRILPALFLVVVTCIPIAWCGMLPGEFRDFSKSMVSVPLLLSNYFFRQDVGYFAAEADEKPLLHTWSLSVEEQYYLAFPILLLAFWKRYRAGVIIFLLVVTVASFGYAAINATSDHERLFFDTRGRIWEILAGALIAFYTNSSAHKLHSHGFRESLSLLGLMMIVGAITLYDETYAYPSGWTLAPVVGTMLILMFATPQSTVGRLLSLRAVVQIGLISYSAYLWHQPALAFARLLSHDELDAYQRGGLCILPLGLAYLSWRFIEQPFRNKSIISDATILKGGAFASCLIIGLGLIGNYNHSVINSPTSSFWAQDSSTIKVMASLRDASPHSQSDPLPFSNQPRLIDVAGINARRQEPLMRIGCPIDRALCGDYKQHALNVIILGDSQGTDAYNALAVGFPRVNFIVMRLPGCPPFQVKGEKAKNTQCYEARKMWRQKLQEFSQVKEVVFQTLLAEKRVDDFTDYLDFLSNLKKRIHVIGIGQTYKKSLAAFYEAKASLSEPRPDLSSIRAHKAWSTDDRIKQKILSLGGTFLSRYDFYCPAGLCRDYTLSNTDLVNSDKYHMTVTSAEEYGSYLALNHPDLFQSQD